MLHITESHICFEGTSLTVPRLGQVIHQASRLPSKLYSAIHHIENRLDAAS